jgi:hypothetical protein
VVGLSFGAFSVATTIGGLSVDFWALREAGEPAALASARVIALETLRWAILAVATCIAGVLVLLGLGHRVTWVAPAAWLVVVPLCFAGGLWVSGPRRRERFTVSSGGRLRRALGIAVTALVFIRELMTGPRGLGYTTGYVSTGLPLPFGGSGGVDAAMTGGFVLAGASLSGALLGAVAFRVFNFWLPALGALLSIVTVRGLRARLHEVAEARREPSLNVGAQGAPAPSSAARHPQG